ncbi:unnamed protein product [Phyllotreta striolata]|uniref:Uncharacterized protein n=1 Tax=Phyllotreta striolata TaxID=444603 RepID=A0A9N9TIG1_PHYSR|nr:unnamed protein product [Phyllotreta striolata]
MGNSGSQNTAIELNHQEEEKWAHSFPRPSNSQPKYHFQHKVLPEKTPQLKLRSTNNGEILQSGGTISGRQIRSIEDKTKQYEENFRKSAVQGVQHKLGNSKHSSQDRKLFASEPDLRYALKNDEKRSKKKYRAPSPPKIRNKEDSRVQNEEGDMNPRLPIRKARLFKTRAETKKQPNPSHLHSTAEDDPSYAPPAKPNIKRLSLPDVKPVDFNEFTKELKDVTQRFKNNASSKPIRQVVGARGEASGKESTTPEASPDLRQKRRPAPDGPAKPKQAFYFGMNGDAVGNSSGSDLSSDIDSDENDACKGKIDLQLRPILPKKQLEIPRFSPAAAWRLLSLDANDDDKTAPGDDTKPDLAIPELVAGFGDTTIADDVPLFMEEHIEKYSRPLPSFLNTAQRSCNDKSGDSGISGDEAVPIVYCYDDPEEDYRFGRIGKDEKIASKIDRERASWTPQQDLDESSAEEELLNKPLKQRMKTGPYVFSLSLPRDNHISSYIADKSNFGHYNGLQKFKKSISGVWGNLSSRRDFATNDEPNNNWFLSKSAPNSLTNVIHSLERHKTLEQQQYSGGNTPARLMYLPEMDNHAKKPPHSKLQSKSCENVAGEVEKEGKSPQPLQDPSSRFDDFPWSSRRKPKKYTFQSTIRQIEKKRLSDKLSREAERREKERLRELNAMQRVEEEFQRKRASEKANIRQQLRLFSLDESTGYQSMPNFDTKYKRRSEPDGAFSSASSSPVSSLSSRKRGSSNKRTHQQVSKLTPSSTKELSEFRQTQVDYKDYNSNMLKHANEMRYYNKQTTIHPQVSCTMSQVKGLNANAKQKHNYRKEFASGIRNIESTDNYREYRKKHVNKHSPSTGYGNHFVSLEH